MPNPKEIAKQARVISEELIVFARLLEHDDSVTSVTVPTPIEYGNSPPLPNTPPLTKPKQSSYQSNPTVPGYDPPPPFEIESPPSRDIGVASGKILIEKGTIIPCQGCKQQVLITNRDIDDTNNPGKGLSLAAYNFLIPNVDWSDAPALYHESTGKATDCPVCHAHKGIWLYGSPPTVNIKGVGSV